MSSLRKRNLGLFLVLLPLAACGPEQDSAAATDVDSAELATHQQAIGSGGGSDSESHMCGKVREWGKIQWEQDRQSELVNIESSALKQMDEAAKSIVRNLSYSIKLRTLGVSPNATHLAPSESSLVTPQTGGRVEEAEMDEVDSDAAAVDTDATQNATGSGTVITWWSSGTHTASSGKVTRSLPRYWWSKANRPYVHLEMGKVGDGKANCAFNIFPLEGG